MFVFIPQCCEEARVNSVCSFVAWSAGFLHLLKTCWCSIQGVFPSPTSHLPITPSVPGISSQSSSTLTRIKYFLKVSDLYDFIHYRKRCDIFYPWGLEAIRIFIILTANTRPIYCIIMDLFTPVHDVVLQSHQQGETYIRPGIACVYIDFYLQNVHDIKWN